MPNEHLLLHEIREAREGREDELARLHGIDALDRLLILHGLPLVHAWLVSLAALRGEDLPCHRRTP